MSKICFIKFKKFIKCKIKLLKNWKCEIRYVKEKKKSRISSLDCV